MFVFIKRKIDIPSSEMKCPKSVFC